MIKNTWISYSGGKDATLALYYLLQDKNIKVAGLFSTYNQSNDRISMHGVSIDLMQQQAKSLGLPLKLIPIPPEVSYEVYDSIMHQFLNTLKEHGVTTIAFGDIFLEDLKEYRTKRLKEVGLEAIFPLWKRPTEELYHTFVDLNFKAITVCIDATKLTEIHLGKDLDYSFKKTLPAHVDVCGENGEFHSFVYNGPIFSKPILFNKGEIVSRFYSQKEEKFEFKFIDITPIST